MLSENPLKANIINKVAMEFSHATDLAIVVTNIHGKEISDCHNFTPFCQMMRNNPKYQALCQYCDQCGGMEASKLNRAMIYRCHSGLIDLSIPLMAEDHLFGFLLFGQVRVEDCQDIPLINQQQSTWHYDHNLTDYYAQIPRVEYQKILASAELLQIIVDYYLHQHLLDFVSRQHEQQSRKLQQDNDERNHIKLDKALKYINAHLADALRLEQVAEHVYLSPYYFSKFFKKQLGIGFNHYLTQQRIKQAQKLLGHSDIPIANIAKKLGFSQASYFCKVFRDCCQITPQEYRNLQRISIKPKK